MFIQVKSWTRNHLRKSKIKTKQQRLIPYFFVTHEFNCLFLFGESAYVNYAPLCLRKIRVKNIFQHKHKHFDRMQTWEYSPPTTTTNPHLSAPPLAHWRKLNICLLSPSLLQNLASLSNFSFFFSVFFFSWSGLGFPCRSRIQFTAFFLAQFFSVFSYRRLGDSSAGTEGPVQTATRQDSAVLRPNRWECSLDPCADLPGRLIEVHHTWEHQRLASIEIISWPRELLAFEL